jgi:methionine-rich copper-binding protein CopC
MRNVARLIALSTTSVLLVGFAPGIALAAATRSAEAPVAGSVISTMPSPISATFAGETILPGSTFTVTQPAGDTHFACTVIPPSGATLSCTPSHVGAADYTDGLYTVNYAFSSIPGGSTTGSFTFVLDATAAPTNLVISPSPFTASTPSSSPIGVTGKSLAGANVSVTLSSTGQPATVTNTVTAASDGSFSTSFSNTIADGTIKAHAAVTGTGGTSGPFTETTMNKDTLYPSLSGTPSTTPDEGGSEKSTTGGRNSGITAFASEVLKTGVSGSTITLKDAANSTVPVTVDFPITTWIRATPNAVLAQGTYTATISLIDEAGNAAAPVIRHFVIDDTAPNAPSYNAPGLINKANKTAYVVSGTGEPGATLNLTLADSGALHSVSGSTTVLSSGVSSGTWQVTVNASTLNDGTVSLSATQTDGALNTSAAALASTIKDTVSPHVSGLAFNKSAYKDGDTTAVLTGTVDNNAGTPAPEADTVIVTVTDSGTGTATGSGTADALGHFSVNVPIGALADGTLLGSAVASDAATNASAPDTANSTKDTVLPATPTVTATHPINSSNQTVVLVSGVAEKSAKVFVTVNDNDPTTDPITPPFVLADASTGAYSVSGVDVSSLKDGTLTFSAIAQDAALNNSGTGTFQTTKDTVAPSKPTVVLPSYVNAANAAAVPISGAADTGSTVSITVTDTTTPTPLTVTKTVLASSGAYSTTLDLHGLKDGTLSFLVFATDAAGNPGGATTPTPTLTKDVVAPGAPINLLIVPSPLDYAHRASDVTVSGTAAVADRTAGLLADVTLVDTDNATPNVVVTGIAVDSATGAFTTTIPNALVLGLTDGTLQVRVALRDAAGNQGPTAVPTLVKDVTKLAVTSRSPVDGSLTQSVSNVVVTLNEALVTGTSPAAPPYSSITVTNHLGNAVLGSLQFTNGNKTLTFTPSSAFSEAASPYTVTLHATDANDTNDLVDSVTHFAIDATAPVAPTLSSVTTPINSLNENAVSVSGNATEAGLTVKVTISDGTLSVSKSGTSGSDGSFTITGIDVTTLADGQLGAKAMSTDAALNAGPDSGTVLATKKASLPTVSGLAATATHYGQLTSTVTGSISEPGTVLIAAVQGSTQKFNSATVAGDNTFSGTLDLSGFASGPVSIRAKTTDAFGNPSAVVSITITHDAATPPAAPAAPVAVAGDRRATVSFTAPATGGAAITSYTVVSSPGGKTATGSASPLTVSGLTNGVVYTFKVKATNRVGSSPLSAASNGVKPMGTSSVTLNALPSRVIAGTIIRLTGTLKRTDTSTAVQQVVIKVRYDNGTIVTLAKVTVSSTGAYSYAYKPYYNRAYSVSYPGDVRNKATTTTFRKVYVSPRITASAPSGSHTTNQVITGSVSPNKAGTIVYLYKITSTGALVKLASAKLSSTSTYRFSVRLPAGSTKLRVVIPATANNAGGSVTFTAHRT